MKTTTILGPEHWAPYLINGDEESLSVAELAKADAWIKQEGYGFPIDCKPAGFGYSALVGMRTQLATYVFVTKD